MLDIAIVGCGYLPNPAVKGGAVETLVDSIVQQNESARQLRIHVFSTSDDAARRESEKYQFTEFHYIDVPAIVSVGDKLIYHFARDIFRKSNSVSYRFILQRLHFIRKVGKAIADMDLDWLVLENHATLLRVLKVANNREKYRGKLIYHMHNEVHNTFGCSEELSECRRIVGVSDFVNRVISDSNPDVVKPEQLCVLRNKVDASVFDKAAADGASVRIRERLGITDEERMILFTGRVCPEKGVLELIEAFEKARIPEAKLVIAGAYFFGSELKTPFEENLHERAVRLGERVIFTGYVNHEVIPAYYLAADVVAVPSVWEDPAPLAIVEAVTAGKKIVTTNSGGIPEYAKFGDATIVERGDGMVDRFAEALRKAVEDCEGKPRPKGWDSRGYYNDFVDILVNAGGR